jgi:hypothetical protein
MIRVEIEQYRRGPVLYADGTKVPGGWECEIAFHHARDGEYEPHTESYAYDGEWFDAVKHAHSIYGDEISELNVRYSNA